MIAQTVKLASALGLVALLSFVALQSRWFEQGGAAIGTMLSARDPMLAARGSAVPSVSASPAGPTPAIAVVRPAARAGMGVVELSPDRNAQFVTEVEINGARIHALVDTGASHVMLTAEDARAINLDPPASAYTIPAQTANGTAFLAPARLRELRVGEITEYDVQALVAKPGQNGISLLGMSFLKKLSSFQVADGHFVMKQ